MALVGSELVIRNTGSEDRWRQSGLGGLSGLATIQGWPYRVEKGCAISVPDTLNNL